MEKYKVIANKKQLISLGITTDITGLIGELKYKYETGWYAIEINHNTYEIPKTFLKLINNDR